MMKPMFSNADIDRWFDIFEENFEHEVIRYLQKAGEHFIIFARDTKTFENHTNNLRSSIGYVIVKDGNVLFEDFKKTGDGTKEDGTKGIVNGKKLAMSVAPKVNGIALVCVAGMNYAIYVEAKGFDVISGSVLQTEIWLNKSIQQTMKQYG